MAYSLVIAGSHFARRLSVEDAAAGEGFHIIRDPNLGKPLLAVSRPPRDCEGRQAVDVLEQFLVHVRNNEIDEAKTLCRFSVFADDEAERQKKLAASEALFPEFMRELQQATSYTLGFTVKQKSVYWTMRVVAEGVKQQPLPYRVYFGYEDEKWRIDVHDLVARYRE